MLDLVVRQANLCGHEAPRDIACRDGRIVEVAPRIEAVAVREIDATGRLVTPPFVDSHFHLDTTLTLHGQPRRNESGTLLEGIALWGDLKPLQPGCHADLVILQAPGPIEAIRLRAPRLQVIRRGRVIAETPAVTAQVHLDGKEMAVDFSLGC